jgi:hypothetical protein
VAVSGGSLVAAGADYGAVLGIVQRAAGVENVVVYFQMVDLTLRRSAAPPGRIARPHPGSGGLATG